MNDILGRQWVNGQPFITFTCTSSNFLLEKSYKVSYILHLENKLKTPNLTRQTFGGFLNKVIVI